MIERQAIQALADEIARRFDVERIILFGSYAYGTPTEDSDVDLLVIMEFEERPILKAVEITKAVRNGFYLDVHVCRPHDSERRYVQLDPLIRHAFDGGVTLYDRADQRMDRKGRVGLSR